MPWNINLKSSLYYSCSCLILLPKPASFETDSPIFNWHRPQPLGQSSFVSHSPKWHLLGHHPDDPLRLVCAHSHFKKAEIMREMGWSTEVKMSSPCPISYSLIASLLTLGWAISKVWILNVYVPCCLELAVNMSAPNFKGCLGRLEVSFSGSYGFEFQNQLNNKQFHSTNEVQRCWMFCSKLAKLN